MPQFPRDSQQTLRSSWYHLLPGGSMCLQTSVFAFILFFILVRKKHTSYYARFSYFCHSCQDATINSAFTFNSFKHGTFYSTFLLLNYFSLFLKISFIYTMKSDCIYPAFLLQFSPYSFQHSHFCFISFLILLI